MGAAAIKVHERRHRERVARGARAEQMRRSFARFVRGAWHVNQGAKELKWTRFLEAFCAELQAIVEGWLAANGFADAYQIARVIEAWERHGLVYEEGEVLVQNECFNLAPGTLKSTIIMEMLPAWVWLHYAATTFACTSGNDENVVRDSERCKALVQSEWYRQTFGVQWSIKGKGSTQRWSTTAKGGRISRSFLGGWVGIHVDFLLADDLIDALSVWSDAKRKEVNSKFSDVFENRVNNMNVSIRILTHQRVHPEDPTGHLRAKKKWTPANRKGWALFVIPMRFGFGPGPANDNESETLYQSPFGWKDPRTIKGEVMQPELWPPDIIADELINKTEAGFSAQLDQNPDSLKGGWFAKQLWRFFKVEGEANDRLVAMTAKPRPRPEGCTSEAPYVLETNKKGEFKLDWFTISVDASGGTTAETSSSCGITVIGGIGMRRFVFDDATALMTFPQMIEAVKRLIKLFTVRRVLIELKAAGGPMEQTLREQVASGEITDARGRRVVVVVEGFNPGRASKEERGKSMVPDVEAGLWYLLDGAPWLADFLNEVAPFPFHRKKDRVDTLSQVSIKYAVDDSALRKARALARR